MAHPLDKLIKARSALLLKDPFYAALAMRLKLVVDENIPTLCTDGVDLRANPAFLKDLTVDQCKGEWVHEMWHILAKHHLRMEHRHRLLANIAMDKAIDPMVRRGGFTMSDISQDDEFAGHSFEYIYEKIKDRYTIIQIKLATAGSGDSDDGDEGSTPPQGGEQVQDKNGNEVKPHGEVSPHPAHKKGDMAVKKAEEELNQQIQMAYQVAKQQGKVPAEVDRLIDELTNPVLPWKEILSRFLTAYARSDYTWKSPNRRYVQHGLYMPRLYNEVLGKVGWYVDTSGSINLDELRLFGSEIQGALMAFPGTDTIVVYCDSNVCNVEEFSSEDVPLDLHPCGGGGTDFCPPFEYIEEEKVELVCAVYLTDGYCNSFPDEPEYPVLWAVSTPRQQQEFSPPFGEVVYVDLSESRD